jgi:hypothetical protein
MTPRLSYIAAPIGTLALLLGNGCLERLETIKVNEDTSIELTTVLKGDEADLHDGDAVPMHGGVWNVSDMVKRTSDDKPDGIERRCELRLPPGSAIPDTYAMDEASREVSLRFPTSLAVEVRGDGMYYHFRREYLAREFAAYNITKRLLEEDDGLKALTAKKADELTTGERARLIDALCRMELDKHERYLAAGMRAIHGAPQDIGLRIRSAVLAASESFDRARALTLLELPPSEERDKEIAALAQQFDADLRTAMERQLAAEPLLDRERETYRTAYDAERRRHAVTEDLQDERWEVRLILPGKVIAHNADREEDGALVWVFEGSALRDMSKELMATSVVWGPGR